nr:tigger transposable element-derived protein 4-like [Parasteatoda tepidariorum]
MSRKRKSISVKENIEILKEFDKGLPGRSKADLAKMMGIPVSILKTIIHDRLKIEEHAKVCRSSSSKKMRVQEGKFPEKEKILLQFFNQCRASNIPVSGPMLMEKAKEIAIKLNLTDSGFTAGWLQKFKAMVGQVVNGESRKVPADSVAEWRENLPGIKSEYLPKDIFNADETGLFYHLMPNQTLVYKGENCKGGKKSKNRLTVLLCANSDGSEKSTPLVIGKSKNPRCLKNIRTLPLDYDANKNAWMTTVIFTKWLKKLDNAMRRKKRKILLFIDQCPAHPPDTNFLENLKVHFFSCKLHKCA